MKIIIPLSLILIITTICFYFLFPFGLPNGNEYFKSLDSRELQKDEKGQFNFVYENYGLMDITGDEFPGWDKTEQLRWRYGIAFSSYAMPSIAIISKEHKDRAIHALSIMIKKMKSRKVWGDWIDYGMGDDPISEGNVMYKGHLNLMYGIYQLMTGDEKFSSEYTWLTNQIIDEMRRHHSEGKYEGADCEPGRYFAQCNSIALLSLKIYDKLYNTEYSNNEAQWTIDFIKNNMTGKKYGFYLKMYNTDQNFCYSKASGYTNAWTMTFLRSFDKDYNESLYKIWKEHFTKEIGPYAYVKEDIEAGANPLATITGMIAAKEFGDVELFTKLRNSVDRSLYMKEEAFHYIYKNINNPIYNGPLLWTKVHIGWQNILDHNWGYNKNFIIPDVSDIVWRDILDQEVLVLE